MNIPIDPIISYGIIGVMIGSLLVFFFKTPREDIFSCIGLSIILWPLVLILLVLYIFPEKIKEELESVLEPIREIERDRTH